MSVFLRNPATLPKKFFTKWRKVTPSPSAIAGRYICWLKLPGLVTTLTPTAMFFYLLVTRTRSAHLSPEDDRGRGDHVRDRDGQQALPAELHQLVRAEARQRPADEQLERAEREDLHRPEREHHQHEREVREVRGQRVVDGGAPVPAAEEQGDHDGARGHDLQELAQEEHAEAQAGVLHEVADDLGLALGDVERGPLGLGDGCREEQQEARRLGEDAPARLVLREIEDVGLAIADRARL